MEFDFSGELWFWRGPAPWHFVSAPADACDALSMISPRVSYGWGMIPATVRIGASEWPTALWPKDGGYIVPGTAWGRAPARLEGGDDVRVRLLVEI